jgi:hypothetical protein
MGAKENVAWQGLQNPPHAFVIFGDLRIGRIVDEFIAGIHIRTDNFRFARH